MKSLRGATTIKVNSEADIRDRTIELWDTIVKYNKFEMEDIVSVIFTATEDIDAAYPGKFIRLERGLTGSSILHFNEMKVQGSLPLCIRVLIQFDLPKETEMIPVYLHEAADLRPDLKLPSA